MFSSSQLNDDQKSLIETWASAGDQLDDIQKKLREECSLSLTYMETRFLILDLNIDLQSEEDPEPEETTETAPPPATEPAQGAPSSSPPPTSPPTPPPAATAPPASPIDATYQATTQSTSADLAAGVELTVDQIAIPGTMVSGKVTFTDGKKAGWYVDTNGQLGLECDDPTYRPSETDLSSFQKELRRSLDSH